LNESSFFIKDDWKIFSSLTLNLGLRWEHYGVPYIGSGFTTTTPDQGLGLFGAGRTGLGGANPFDKWLTPGISI
jgi:outer membrane receptor protein involved in Fe transport